MADEVNASLGLLLEIPRTAEASEVGIMTETSWELVPTSMDAGISVWLAICSVDGGPVTKGAVCWI